MKIKDTATLPNGQCLVEIEDRFYRKTESNIIVGSVDYNKSDHAIRYGTLRKLPDSFNWEKESWRTESFPDVDVEVWFDYLDAKETTMVEYKGYNCIILPYHSLIVSRSASGSIKVLNGYLLAKKQPIIEENALDFKQRYYDDIYEIVYAGYPNVSYRPDRDKNGNITREIVDDKSIVEGMIVMTRSSAYPVLEDKLHRKFSKEELFYFQRKDCIGKVMLND